MIPRTYPTSLHSSTGRRQMVVYFLSSVTGLTRWVDYIPVQWGTANTPRENSTDTGGYLSVDSLSSTTGKQAWVDYIPVYLDASATGNWTIDSVGFLPIGLSGVGGMPIGLFAAGEQGVWYDPSDMSTMYQDSAGSTPVTAVGQPVGRILDKSGRGNHATQATAASRPTLQQDASGNYYLSFDGVDDSLATGSIDFSATDKMTVFAGVHKASDAARGMVLELGPPSATGFFAMNVPTGAGSANFGFTSGGTTAGAFANSPITYPAPYSAVLTGQGDIAADGAVLRINSTQAASSAGDQGTGNYSNAVLYIGRRGGSTLPFNGRLYSLVVRGAATDATQVSATERYVASKSGISL